MMRFSLLILISWATVGNDLSEETRQQRSKEKAIEELIKIENENKALHFGAIDLQNFSEAVAGGDTSNCFEKRCISNRQLQIKITGADEGTPIHVDLGGHTETIRVSPQGNKLGFAGTLGNHFVGELWANACRNHRLTGMTIRNNSNSPVPITKIELGLDNGNGVIKTIFASESSIVLVAHGEKSYSRKQITENSAYQSARIGSCRD